MALLWPPTNAKCCPTFHFLTNAYGHSTVKTSGLVPSHKQDSISNWMDDRLEKQGFVDVFWAELRRRHANQRAYRFCFEKWQPIATFRQQVQYISTKVSCPICLLNHWPRILQFIYAQNQDDAKGTYLRSSLAYGRRIFIISAMSFLNWPSSSRQNEPFPSPRQNRSDRSQDRRESVPGQSVDCCIHGVERLE